MSGNYGTGVIRRGFAKAANSKTGTATIVTGGWIQVTFAEAFAGTDYVIKFGPAVNGAIPSYTDKLATGFKLWVQSTAITGDVDWEATYNA